MSSVNTKLPIIALLLGQGKIEFKDKDLVHLEMVELICSGAADSLPALL